MGGLSLAGVAHRVGRVNAPTPLCAVVDIGTNSVRLLIATPDAAGGVRQVERHIRVTRLGQGVDETGVLHPDAIARTTQVLADYAQIWRGHNLPDDQAVLMATSAVRDAQNADAFLRSAQAACGVTPQVISGDLEAEIAFLGATANQPPGPKLVIDIGGGSTEFVASDARGTIIGATSQQVGCVRVTERVGRPPYTPDQISAIRVQVREIITQAAHLLPRPLAPGTILIGVAGTVTTLAALELGLASYQPDRIHGTVVAEPALAQRIIELAALSPQAIEALGPVEGNRGDVLPVGAIILDEIMREFGLDTVIASEHDSLDGMAAKCLRQTVSQPPC